MKWIELSEAPDESRYKRLSEFLRKNSIENEFASLKVDSDHFYEELEKAKSEFDQIKIGLSFGVSAMDFSTSNPSQTETIGTADSYFHKDNQWWMRNYDYLAAQNLLSNVGNQFKSSQAALIVGSGPMARVMFSALSKLGYKRVDFINLETERGKELLEHLSRNFFDVEIQYIFQHDLVQLSGTHNLLINTIPYKDEFKSFFDEISFFNFLQENSMVWDVSGYFNKTALLERAAMAKFPIISGDNFFSRSDLIWANEIFNANLDIQKYLEDLSGV